MAKGDPRKTIQLCPKILYEISESRVDNPVASRHMWRIGHDSVATFLRQKNCQISQ
jgi:hypothetical protein